MRWIGWAALAVLAAIAARQLFPRTVTEYLPGPPSRPDTIYVDRLETDTVFRDRIRTEVVTDTVNITHTVTIADTVHVPYPVPARWYLDRLYAPVTRGDTALVSLVQVGADSASLWTRSSLHRLWVPGPIRSIETRNGLRVDFWELPEVKSCTFFCRAELVLLGVAGGILVRELF